MEKILMAMEKLPERLNKLPHTLAENNVSFKIDAFDEKHTMEGFQKVANRITAVLILAALIVGSALLMQIPTDFILFGYSRLAMIFFLTAVLGSSYLWFKTFIKDENSSE